MKSTCLLALLAAATLSGACSTTRTVAIAGDVHDGQHDEPHEAVLIVSLDDGSVIKQTIDIDADLCFKMISDTSTTCLKQGEAIVDPDSDEIIGFEMIEGRIDLVAKSN